MLFLTPQRYLHLYVLNNLILFLTISCVQITSNSIMIFIKYFDVSKQSLYGIGKTYVQRTSKVGDLCHVINEKMRWTPGTPLKLYEVCYQITFIQRCTHSSSLGDQADHDRADEAQSDFRPERNSRWRYHMLPGRNERKRVCIEFVAL